MPTTHAHTPTYYEILSLSPSALTSQSSSDPTPTADLIKRAYRRALLNHHPDKKGSNTNPPNSHSHSHSHSHHTQQQPTGTPTTFTIDQISTAYATLSRPTLRQAYDRTLLQQTHRHSEGQSAGQAAEFQTGIETVDLDDLDCEDYSDQNCGEGENETRWYRSCRCGNPRGYQFAEADLEDAADLGELMVGCADCSLWLRVHFAVVDEDDGDEQQGNGNGDGGGAKGGSEGQEQGARAETGER
jgi:DnaJ-class molecular chaperone